ncbi:hypothetical protein LL037_24470 [Clostridium estertheticum]|uniref:hypothetical protein n=1 Tax=Clostridium estertheticum TaxID=238834 RepID=UPI001C0CC93C|nr:hypothetical protein [Clostridium estertheticum]MBU3197748.1 hypothetical protein [Clostridium estertheticum]WAG65550.1 hypothetical protein LL037_24470 [Clostridium estertheticum]
MIKIKKILSMSLVALFVTVGSLTNVTANAATVATPTINYAGIEHSPLVVGDTETFTVTAAKFSGDVQYRAFIGNEAGKWTELTTGYTAAVSSKTPYVLPASKALTLGKYKVSIWVKTAGKTGVKSNSTGNFDSYYVAGLNCVSKDDNNRVYTNGVADVAVTGLTAKFNGISQIGGIAGPYLYQLFAMDTATGTWLNGPAGYSATPSMTFKTPGTYMLIAHVNTEKSTTWAKKGYEGWKTVMVKVTNSSTTIFDTTVKAANFGSVGNVTMTTDGLKAFPKATQYQLVAGTSNLTKVGPLGTATTIFPAKVAGDLVTVKLFDASNNELKSIDVKLGQSGTIDVAPVVVTPGTATIAATVKAASFGSVITATSSEAGATQYQVSNGTSLLSKIAPLGTATTLFPAKVVGDTVTIKLFNAAGTVVGTSDVVLTAAK